MDELNIIGTGSTNSCCTCISTDHEIIIDISNIIGTGSTNSCCTCINMDHGIIMATIIMLEVRFFYSGKNILFWFLYWSVIMQTMF